MSSNLRSTYEIEHDGRVWLVGGHWTAGGQIKKAPRSVVALAKEEHYPIERTSWVWSSDNEQIGWFIADEDSGPLKGYPLALQVSSRLEAKDTPFRGLFCLGDDIWWLVLTDNTGAIHPLWDLVGPKADILATIDREFVSLSQTSNSITIEDPEAAWAWLLEGELIEERVRPVNSGLGSPRVIRMLATAAAASLLLIGAAKGYNWWKADQSLRAQERAAKIAEEIDKKREEILAQKQAQEIANIKAQWEATPRPWMNRIPWTQFISNCDWDQVPLSIYGWSLMASECRAVSVPNFVVERSHSYRRGKFANIANLPNSALADPSGETWVSRSGSVLPPGATVQDVLGEPLDVVQRKWLSLTQKYAGVLRVSASPAVEYRPPYPPGTTEEVKKKIQPPVLWREINVEILSSIPPSSDWEVLQSAGFVPTQLAMTRNGSKMQWKVTGVQYVQ